MDTSPISFKEFLLQKNTIQVPVSGDKTQQVDATMKNLMGSTDIAPGEGQTGQYRSEQSVQ